jgi:hypothetical protein
VVGTIPGPHSPRLGWTRGGVPAFRLRFEKTFGTPPA